MHLLKDTQKSIFKTTIADRNETGPGEVAEMRDPRFATQPDMTPDDAAAMRRSNYPRYSEMDVVNVMRPRRGYGY